MARVYEMRTLNALLAAATAVVLVLLATRASSLRAGAVVGLLFALDPFCIRQNDRVLLETALMFWVMLGYLVFTSLIGRLPSRRDWLPRGRCRPAVRLRGADQGRGSPAHRSPVARCCRAPVGAPPGVDLAHSRHHRRGLRRLCGCGGRQRAIRRLLGGQDIGHPADAGADPDHRLPQPGGGSLSARLIGEARYFGTTYVVLALAVPAVVVLLRRGGQLQRMLGLLYCAAGVTLAYAVVLGTLEEQELYLLIVPSLLIIPVAAALLLDESQRFRRQAQQRRRILQKRVVIAALLLALSINLATCLQWLRRPDDGWALFVHGGACPGWHPGRGDSERCSAVCAHLFVPLSVPPGYPEGYQVVVADPGRPVHRARPLHRGGMGAGRRGLLDHTPSQVRHLVVHGRLVFSFWGRTYGQLALYKLQRPLGSVHTRR